MRTAIYLIFAALFGFILFGHINARSKKDRAWDLSQDKYDECINQHTNSLKATTKCIPYMGTDSFKYYMNLADIEANKGKYLSSQFDSLSNEWEELPLFFNLQIK